MAKHSLSAAAAAAADRGRGSWKRVKSLKRAAGAASQFFFRRRCESRCLLLASYSTSKNLQSAMYSIVERGAPNSADYRIYFRDQNGPISPLHDIPLYADEEKKIYNMVVEIPRWTNAKMEISMKEVLNPIKQDVKKDKLRPSSKLSCRHSWPIASPTMGTFGTMARYPKPGKTLRFWTQLRGARVTMTPSTLLRSVNVSQSEEISFREITRKSVKVLGALALIDEGETDWKLLAIDVTDPQAEHMRDVQVTFSLHLFVILS
ncbi:hypothetical protein B566_EDAN017627 [Ephemera danica]|nr:hypothetical protein B566_EDAN017627 [Ephemera danica]